MEANGTTYELVDSSLRSYATNGGGEQFDLSSLSRAKVERARDLLRTKMPDGYQDKGVVDILSYPGVGVVIVLNAESTQCQGGSALGYYKLAQDDMTYAPLASCS